MPSPKSCAARIPKGLFIEDSFTEVLKAPREEQPEVCGTRILSLADAPTTQTITHARLRKTTGEPTETEKYPRKGKTCMPTNTTGCTAPDPSHWRQPQFSWLQRSFAHFSQKLKIAFFFLHYASHLAHVHPARDSHKLAEKHGPPGMTVPTSERRGCHTNISTQVKRVINIYSPVSRKQSYSAY